MGVLSFLGRLFSKRQIQSHKPQATPRDSAAERQTMRSQIIVDRAPPALTQPKRSFAVAEDRDWFWSIVDATLYAYSEPDLQCEALSDELKELALQDQLEFAHLYSQAIKQAHTFDLWGAAYFAMGGCNDEEFEYFRDWLIAQGRIAFEAVTRDPDCLAAFLPMGKLAGTPMQLEAFRYVVWEVMEGQTLSADFTDRLMPTPDSVAPSPMPYEEEWDFDDDVEMMQRYPNLAESLTY